MEYAISRKYYSTLIKELGGKSQRATHKEVVEYLNKIAGIKGGIKKVRFY